MTLYPPLWAQSGTYSAREDRRMIGAAFPDGGATTPLGMAVTARTPSVMGIDVAAGAVVVPTSQGQYLCVSDATVPITISAAPPTNQERKDLIYVLIEDPQAFGTGSQVRFQILVLNGTPGPVGSSQPPAVPAQGYPLAEVRSISSTTQITTALITDRRARASQIRSFPNRAARAAAIPSPGVGQVTMLDDWPGYLHAWDGSGWLVEQQGQQTTTTDPNSFIIFTWPKPFQNVPAVLASAYGTTTYSQIVVPLAGGGNLTATGCNFVVRANTGTTFPNTAIAWFWQATGYS